MAYLTFTVEVDGDIGAQPAQIFEKILRCFLNQSQVLNIQKAGGDTPGVYTALPSIEQSATLNALIIATDQPINLKVASVAPGDGIIALKAGGMLMIVDGSLAAGISSNVLINNVGVNSATLTGAAGGT